MRFPAVFAIAALLASGCLGIPEGAPDQGDVVTADWTAYDAETGTEVASGTADGFVLGSGESDLGLDFERHLIGVPAGETVSFVSESDPSRDFTEQITTDRVFGPHPLEVTVPRGDFTNFIGEPSLGQRFEVSFYDAEVTQVTDTEVTYRVLAEDGQRDPVAFIGATLVTTLNDDDTMTQTLDPDVGATFDIAQPSPFNPNTPLGLAPGAYRTAGADGDQIVYDYDPGMHAAIRDRAVRFEVTITSVEPAASSGAPDGDYGRRDSPQLLGDPSAARNTTDADHHDHGHADDGHTH